LQQPGWPGGTTKPQTRLARVYVCSSAGEPVFGQNSVQCVAAQRPRADSASHMRHTHSTATNKPQC
jgi:hypothetical protein